MVLSPPSSMGMVWSSSSICSSQIAMGISLQLDRSDTGMGHHPPTALIIPRIGRGQVTCPKSYDRQLAELRLESESSAFNDRLPTPTPAIRAGSSNRETTDCRGGGGGGREG